MIASQLMYMLFINYDSFPDDSEVCNYILSNDDFVNYVKEFVMERETFCVNSDSPSVSEIDPYDFDDFEDTDEEDDLD